MPAREIGKMKADESDEDKKGREDFGNGISVEGEFAFTKALGDFCRASVKEGN